MIKKSAAVLATVALIVGSGAAWAATGARDLRRLEGDSRFTTAVQISREAFPNGASTVYLARSDGFADALAGSSLTDRGPILLVPQCGPVPAEVLAEANRLAPLEIVALGGSGAVCDGVLQQFAGSISDAPVGADSISISGSGEENSDPFVLGGGDYAVSYNFSGTCQYGAFLEPTNNDNIFGESIANGDGPISGETNLFDIDPTEYFVNMIANTSQGCPWTVTFTSR